MSRFFFLALCCLLFGAEHVEGEELSKAKECGTGEISQKFFENRPYFEPLAASRHEAQSTLFFGKSTPFPFMSSGGKHTFMEPSLGTEIPIVMWDRFGNKDYRNKDDRDIPMPAKCLGFGVWFAGGFHTFLDFDESGQPIVDIDMRVGLMGKVAYGLSDRSRFGFRFQICHESSHLTSDFARNAVAAFGEKFKDKDVNYECLEFGVNLDHKRSWGTLSLRSGAMFAMGRGHTGFYSARGVDIVPSRRNSEPYIGLQLMPNQTEGWGAGISYVVYGLTTYDYTRESRQTLEAMRISQSIAFVLRDFGKGRGVPDFAIRCYSGRNPYGPLRDQNTWRSCGAGIIMR